MVCEFFQCNMNQAREQKTKYIFLVIFRPEGEERLRQPLSNLLFSERQLSVKEIEIIHRLFLVIATVKPVQ